MPDMVLGRSPGLNVTMVQVAVQATHWYDPHGRVALKDKHRSMWMPRRLTSACPLMVSVSKDINIDPSCSRTMNSDVALGRSPDLDNTMTQGNTAGHSDLGANMATGCCLDSQAFCVAFGGTTGHRHQHKSQLW